MNTATVNSRTDELMPGWKIDEIISSSIVAVAAAAVVVVVAVVVAVRNRLQTIG